MLNASQQSCSLVVHMTVRDVLPYRSSHASVGTTATLAAKMASTTHLIRQGRGRSTRGPSGIVRATLLR